MEVTDILLQATLFSLDAVYNTCISIQQQVEQVSNHKLQSRLNDQLCMFELQSEHRS